jgi:hypothetical protein
MNYFEIAVLSVSSGWDHYLVLLACLFGFYVCGRILWEEYGPDFNSKRGYGEDKQCGSEKNNAAGGNLSQLRRYGQDFSHATARSCGSRRGHVVCLNVGKFIMKSLKSFLKFFVPAHDFRRLHPKHKAVNRDSPKQSLTPGSKH